MNTMKTTREKVLMTIKLHPKSTIIEIADQVDINAISVRHHLTNLQAEGLIMAEEERHGIGRPRLVYSLTDRGMENFPSRYFHLVNSLMDQIKETLPEKDVNSIFHNMAEKLTSDYEPMLAKMSMEERLELLKTILNNEGFDVEWEQQGQQCCIKEISCPYFKIGDNHPEVCLFDKSIISNILDIPINKISHQDREEDLCTYTIDLADQK
ncbi:MAG: helix-turn-helix transcriptional regulator [Anaerolineaceae bacterium]